VIYFQSLSREDLQKLLLPLSRDEKQARYRAKQIFHWVYQRFETDWEQMSDVSKATRSWLKENVEIFRLTERHSQQAMDGTMKFLWNLPDGKTVESVIIPAALQTDEEGETPADSRLAGREATAPLQSGQWGRLTACISSQVGCAMACKFCLTGVQGLDRHLSAHEIVAQVYELRRLAPISNIVFMGMGEPLHNFENVVKACEILIDPDGLGLSRRKVTVSTSGLVPAIDELGKRVAVSLAISLNGTTDEQRTAIMPVNKRWPIAELLAACRRFPLGGHRRITFEYVMLKGLNDSLEDAARMLKLLEGIPAKINLIPFNEHAAAEYKRPADETVRAFQRYLLDRGLTATVRISRGRDILAACGQLRSIFGTARGSDRHADWSPEVLTPVTG
jgi:23S rRNA (adenine2503-C2)-methyltransferase